MFLLYRFFSKKFVLEIKKKEKNFLNLLYKITEGVIGRIIDDHQ